jgi:hypothetical protein
MSASKSRTSGQSIIRKSTGLAVTSAIVGTAGLAFYVGHEYGDKSGATSSTVAPAQPSSIQPFGDDGSESQGYSNPYERQESNPYGGQQYPGGYAPSPGNGGPPQASTGGS